MIAKWVQQNLPVAHSFSSLLYFFFLVVFLLLDLLSLLTFTFHFTLSHRTLSSVAASFIRSSFRQHINWCKAVSQSFDFDSEQLLVNSLTNYTTDKTRKTKLFLINFFVFCFFFNYYFFFYWEPIESNETEHFKPLSLAVLCVNIASDCTDLNRYFKNFPGGHAPGPP